MRRRRIDDRLWRMEEAYATRNGHTKMLCNCDECHGGKVLLLETVRNHYMIHGRDPLLQRCSLPVRSPLSLQHFSLNFECNDPLLHMSTFRWVIVVKKS